MDWFINFTKCRICVVNTVSFLTSEEYANMVMSAYIFIGAKVKSVMSVWTPMGVAILYNSLYTVYVFSRGGVVYSFKIIMS